MLCSIFRTPPRNLKNTAKFFETCGITACTIYVPEAFITVLPEVDKSGRLTFPAGKELTGSWTNIEILEAIKHGAEVRHIKGQWQFEAVPFLRSFVDHFYRLRQAAKDAGDIFGSYAYKILLNSSYGKLTETVNRRSFISAGEISRARANGGKVLTTPTHGIFEVESQEVGPFRHTAAGAYVTAIARLRLFRMAKEMHEKGANIYYCDTDSLMLDMKIEKTGTKLGDWEHVGTIDELELVLPKVYRAAGRFHTKKGLESKTVYKCKGCPIERKWEAPDMPRKRWEAFKNFRFSETNELAEILGKEGISGFISDVAHGSLHPRRLEKDCAACAGTGKIVDFAKRRKEKCLLCDGDGKVSDPLVRSLRSSDKKRDWHGHESMPLSIELPPMRPKAPHASKAPEVARACKSCAGRGCMECGKTGVLLVSKLKPAPPSAAHLAAMRGE